MNPFSITLEAFKVALQLFLDYWWIWLPLMLISIYTEIAPAYSRLKYLAGLTWVMLEIRVPQEPHKSLKAMEQIFEALHSIATPRPPKNLKEKYGQWKARFFEGKTQDWLALEIVSISGEIHYYVRTLEKYRNLIESQIYGHYPESEINQVPDYIAQMPLTVPTEDFDATGVELEFTKDSAFPIKTYPEFEEEHAGREDVRTTDPLAPFAEAMSSISFGEYLALQFVIRSANDGWLKKSQPAIDKVMGKPAKPPESGAIEKQFEKIDQLLMGGAKKEEKKEEKPFNQLNPGVQELVKAMERKTSKLPFESGIRVFYAAPKDRFNGSDRVRMIAAAFKQFSTQALNGFKPGFSVDVERGRNKEQKTLENKPKFFKRYKNREFPVSKPAPFILVTEELATLFHF
ncbi:MAG TPA: hypothetical protein VFK07_03675, partial [Candidatus Paceibacterota bacterium]|nr:hypothetical protein [Candidatus Paceibacterota bacterium]